VQKLLAKLIATVGLTLAALCGGGCQIIGAMAGSYEATGSHEVKTLYDGLDQKKFAVVVRAGQMIQADYPEVVVKLTVDISERLQQNVNASGYVPGVRVIDYLYNHPRWIATPYEDIARNLGVERLIYVELTEYRLQDPGNAYLWQGVSGATVGVIEADGSAPEEFAFRKAIRVEFPDKAGYTANDMTRAVVNTELVRRTVDRVSWLFYDHEEMNRSDY